MGLTSLWCVEPDGNITVHEHHRRVASTAIFSLTCLGFNCGGGDRASLSVLVSVTPKKPTPVFLNSSFQEQEWGWVPLPPQSEYAENRRRRHDGLDCWLIREGVQAREVASRCVGVTIVGEQCEGYKGRCNKRSGYTTKW
jgi:hypothetical protein